MGSAINRAVVSAVGAAKFGRGGAVRPVVSSSTHTPSPAFMNSFIRNVQAPRGSSVQSSWGGSAMRPRQGRSTADMGLGVRSGHYRLPRQATTPAWGAPLRRGRAFAPPPPTSTGGFAPPSPITPPPTPHSLGGRLNRMGKAVTAKWNDMHRNSKIALGAAGGLTAAAIASRSHGNSSGSY